MTRPARPRRALVLASLAAPAAAITLFVACGIDVVGSAPSAEPATTNAPEGGSKSSIEDAAAFDGDATQGECNGGRTVCGDTCTDTTADPSNCGRCGAACPPLKTCNAGKCDVLCVGDTLRCNGACIDPTSDPTNCGTCGQLCSGTSPVCVARTCEADCQVGQKRCSPDGGVGDAGALTYCATTMIDRNNCGACGTVCTQSQSCIAGTCKDLCKSPARVGDVFSPTVVGCVDKRSWDDRALTCPTGSTVCSAAQWNALPNPKKPTFNYWTNDYLQWTGTSSSCAAVPEGNGGPCYGSPMRVCGATTDQAGNSCNWTNCGYNTSTPNQYYGGCQNNGSAGALCCTPPAL